MFMKKINPILIRFFLIAILLSLGGCQKLLPPSPSSTPGVGNFPSDALSSPQDLKVHFLDVGQGDSILAESNGRFLLIDGGENDQGEAVVSYLKQAGVTSLDYVIGTHPHSDHIGGLDHVIREFPTEKIILPPIEHTTKTFEDLLDVVADKGMKITMPKAGDTYPLGNASFQILAPLGDYGDDLNNWSVGIRLSYKNNHLVMCGDAEKDSETDMAAHSKELSADILKIGHHGSRTSTSDEFLDRVSPSYGVIQCGKDNPYGHPHKETLEKLEQRGIQVFRTDQDGSITAICDGDSITWITEKKPAPQNSPSLTPYVLNTNTKKFHLPTCQSAIQMKKANRQDVTQKREALIQEGYTPCKQCKP